MEENSNNTYKIIQYANNLNFQRKKKIQKKNEIRNAKI